MGEKALIYPVKFLGPVECDECGTNLFMKSIDYNVTELGQDGEPLAGDYITITSGVCPKCGKKYELEKDGLYFRIKDRAPLRYKSRGEEKEPILLNNREDKSNPFIKGD